MLSPSLRTSCVLYADADALTGQSDGTTLAGTFGPFGAGTHSNPFPVYHATAVGGKAGLHFDGISQQLRVEVGAVAALDSAMQGSWTAQVVYQPETVSPQYQHLALQGQGSGCRDWLMLASGRPINFDAQQVPTGLPAVTPQLGMPSLFQVSYDSTQKTFTYGMSNGQYFVYEDSGTPSWNGGTAYTFGTTDVGSYPYQGYISKFIVDNVAMTAAQFAADYAFWRSAYAPNKVLVACAGDSRTEGVDTSANPGVSGQQSPYPYPAQLQSLLGAGYTVKNFGVSGSESDVMASPTSAVLANCLGALNPLGYAQAVMLGLCGVNDYRGQTGSSSPQQAAAHMLSGFAQWEAAGGICPTRSLYLTELDYSDGLAPWLAFRSTQRGLITAAFAPVPGQRAIVDLTADARVGAAGSSASAAYWSPDQTHPTGESSTGAEGGGYGVIAGLVAPAVEALATYSAAGGGSGVSDGSVQSDVTAALVALGYTEARAAKLDDLDAPVSSRSTFAGGPVASVTAPVTAGTVTDKAGYTLASFAFSVAPSASDNASAVRTAIATAPVGSVANLTGLSLDGGAVASSPSPSATTFTLTGLPSGLASGDLTGMSLIFQSGNRSGARRTVLTHVRASGVDTVTLATALGAAPAAGDSVLFC